MGLFDDQIKHVQDFLAEKQSLSQVREFQVSPYSGWPSEASLILEEDTALELGNPGIGSMSFIIWSEGHGADHDRILLVGPDLNEIRVQSVPFCQMILVKGSFRDEYECWRELREAVYDTKLEGFMTRVLPSRQMIWCRVDREALAKGFLLPHLGAALIRSLRDVSFVSGAEVIFVTSGKEDMEKLKKPGYDTARIVGAMMKMNEEKIYDCESCEYWDVCKSVAELRMMRRRLTGELAK